MEPTGSPRTGLRVGPRPKAAISPDNAATPAQSAKSEHPGKRRDFRPISLVVSGGGRRPTHRTFCERYIISGAVTVERSPSLKSDAETVLGIESALGGGSLSIHCGDVEIAHWIGKSNV